MDNPDDPQAVVERAPGGNVLTVRVDGRKAGVPLDAFLRAMQRSLAVLSDFDRELADGQVTTSWRIVAASYNSPLMIRLQGSPRSPGRPMLRIVEPLVVGMAELERGDDTSQLPDAVLRNFALIGEISDEDGIGGVQFEAPGLPVVSPTKHLTNHVRQILRTRYYYEDSALEGSLLSIDIHGKPAFGIFDPLTRQRIICRFDRAIQATVVGALGSRVMVEGRVKYNRAGNPVSIEVGQLDVMPSIDDLPQFGPGGHIDITGGIPSEVYVRRQRDAE